MTPAMPAEPIVVSPAENGLVASAAAAPTRSPCRISHRCWRRLGVSGSDGLSCPGYHQAGSAAAGAGAASSASRA